MAAIPGVRSTSPSLERRSPALERPLGRPAGQRAGDVAKVEGAGGDGEPGGRVERRLEPKVVGEEAADETTGREPDVEAAVEEAHRAGHAVPRHDPQEVRIARRLGERGARPDRAPADDGERKRRGETRQQREDADQPEAGGAGAALADAVDDRSRRTRSKPSRAIP